MPLNIRQLRHLVVAPALEYIAKSTRQPSWASPEAVELVMATGYAESRFEAIRQYARKDGRRGPARGMWQCEPRTHAAYWRWLKSSGKTTAQADAFQALRGALADFGYIYPDLDRLSTDLRYAAIMCRIHYRRVPSALPNDRRGMAEYWKRWYNSYKGAGTVDGFMSAHRSMRGIEARQLL